METRNIVLTEHQSQVVRYLVASGRDKTISEVLQTGLRMVGEAESTYITKMRELRTAIDEGQEDMEAGRARQFTGNLFAAYLSERAEQVIEKERKV
ncbi:type II toxin-antitoxin system ParD family antitoxin [Marinobacter salarius]|uniref:ribbon-helix-helix domain-containing protein n=1 Tax=Marinobacter salarius TaxID=1420917 RepID=UPI001BCEFCD6|nr:type II toxin-antitoxin system ParD family antitoxin [Marinobacter salarius]MBS8230282.1 type II toxin-antitoxin system ParD family antitoxin [Marinobacter salarius]